MFGANPLDVAFCEKNVGDLTIISTHLQVICLSMNIKKYKVVICLQID